MAFARRLAAASVAVITLFGLSPGTLASAVPRPAQTPLTSVQTAENFLRIAYTWKKVWYHDDPSIGKRDAPYTAPALDSILKHVYVGPDAMANTTSWIVGSTTEVSSSSEPGGVIAYKVELRIDDSFTVISYAHVKKLAGAWKAVGTYLPAGSGPTRYCVDSPSASAYCRIYPPGSE